MTEFDARDAAGARRVPTASIEAAVAMLDLDRFQVACPQLITGRITLR